MSKLNGYLRSGVIFSAFVLTANLVSGCASAPPGSPAAVAEEAKRRREFAQRRTEIRQGLSAVSGMLKIRQADEQCARARAILNYAAEREKERRALELRRAKLPEISPAKLKKVQKNVKPQDLHTKKHLRKCLQAIRRKERKWPPLQRRSEEAGKRKNVEH